MEASWKQNVPFFGWTIPLSYEQILVWCWASESGRKNAGMLCKVAGARREANKHQLQAGYSLQIMSFGHGWAIDVTILCFSNDAHVGHQLEISLLCCWHPLAVIVSPSLLVFVLARGSPPRSHLAIFLSSPSPSLLFGCDAGQLGFNQNQMDTLLKLSERVWERGELSALQREWNSSVIKRGFITSLPQS